MYSRAAWIESFGSGEYIRKLLSISICSKEYRMELRSMVHRLVAISPGVLFPTDECGETFVLNFPPVVLHSVAAMFGFDDIRLLDPFARTREDDFESYICNALIAFCHCLALDGDVDVILGELFAGAYGTKATLDKKITIKKDMRFWQARGSVKGITQASKVFKF